MTRRRGGCQATWGGPRHRGQPLQQARGHTAAVAVRTRRTTPNGAGKRRVTPKEDGGDGATAAERWRRRRGTAATASPTPPSRASELALPRAEASEDRHELGLAGAWCSWRPVLTIRCSTLHLFPQSRGALRPRLPQPPSILWPRRGYPASCMLRGRCLSPVPSPHAPTVYARLRPSGAPSWVPSILTYPLHSVGPATSRGYSSRPRSVASTGHASLSFAHPLSPDTALVRARVGLGRLPDDPVVRSVWPGGAPRTLVIPSRDTRSSGTVACQHPATRCEGSG